MIALLLESLVQDFKTCVTSFPVQTVQTKFDAKVLHEQPQLAAESGMVDDGKGAKAIFRVDRFDLLQVQGPSSTIHTSELPTFRLV